MKKKFLPLVGLIVLAVFTLVTCDLEELIAELSPVGIYVGVISVDSRDTSPGPITDLVKKVGSSNMDSSIYGNGSLVYLDSTVAVGEFRDKVLNGYIGTGSSLGPFLIYGVDQAISNLKGLEKQLPKTLENVTFVTFTGGKDGGSGDYAKKGDNDAYGATVQKRIRGEGDDGAESTKIKGRPINAYAVGVKSTADPTEQTKTLKYLSSGTTGADNVIMLNDWNTTSLTNTFKDIANSLTSISSRGSVTLTVRGISQIDGSLKDDKNFCVIFDGTNPDDATKKMYAKMTWEGEEYRKYTLTGITLHGGLGGSQPNAKESGRTGVRVEFGLPNVTGVPSTGAFSKQFRWSETANNNAGAWMEMEGGSFENTVTTTATKKTGIIYLVLDANLPTENANEVRTAANAFVSDLYNLTK